jgi:hypothetical protein
MKHGWTRGTLLRSGLLVAGLVAAGALGACSVAGATTAVAPTVVPSTSAPTPAPTTAAPTASAPATSAPTTSAPTALPSPTAKAAPGYQAARAQWQLGATAISAQQGLSWSKAADDLNAGKSTDGGDTSGYAAAITHLKELVTLPDAQQTPAQNAAYHADINALNAFFKTPGLYS